MLLYIIESTRQYNTATPAPSVAVNIPDTIPPITIIISNNDGIALHTVLAIDTDLSLPVALIPSFLAITKAITIHTSPISIPGTYPAINNVDIDTPPATVE